MNAPPPSPPPATPTEDLPEAVHDYRRDRLLSGLVLIAGLGLFLALPFALRAGAVFFMPLTVAIVVALVLVPALEWLERRGLPAGLAALTALTGFIVAANAALVIIVIPAADWVTLLPSKVEQVRDNLAPILRAFATLERMVAQFTAAIGQQAAGATAVTTAPPNSVLELVATSAPAVLLQMFLALLLAYFFLASWTGMRERAILGRDTLGGSLSVARLLRDVVSNTASYILTIASINAVLGLLVAGVVWALGMPTPLMWGGLAALFNFIPYVGPIIVTGLLGLGGLVAFNDPVGALLPAAAFLALHAIEANLVTPAVVGKRLTVSPLAILLALSFWGWVWGTVGALVSVPLLIMGKVVLDRVGRPDILGFLFDGRTLERHIDG